MIIEKIKNKIKDVDNLVLTAGLIIGLSVGLIDGLITGLITGLIFGLIFGLGLFISFFTFLGLASLISHFPNFIPLGVFFITGLILVEMFFWLDKQKPKKKQNKFWFTALKKGEAILETIFVLGCLNLIRLAIDKIKIYDNWEIILKWIGYIGAGLIVLAVIIGVFYLYLKLNSLKYDKK